MNVSRPKSSNHSLVSSRFAACHRHPGEPVTGFCATCLSERLAGLDTTGVKAVFEAGQSSNAGHGGAELSRSKSCSHGRGGFVGVIGTVEPRRKSCDVRARNSLSSLLGIDNGDGDFGVGKGGGFVVVDEGVSGVALGEMGEVGVSKIRVLDEEGETQIGGDGDEEWRTMKEHLDLECRSQKGASKGRDFKNIAGRIWVAAASGLSNKLQKWRQKQKARMPRNGNANGGVEVVNAMEAARMNVREAQSEVGDYGFGRLSCDTDPRYYSIDVGRASVDCPPRFSLDGYLMGRSWVHRPNQMVAVVEDDDHCVENVNIIKGNEIDKSPGGSEQTRDYYGEDLTLTRRRRSLCRSSSRRASSVEIDELRAISNARVSPATVGLFHGGKVLFTNNRVNMPSLSTIKTGRAERAEPSDYASNGAPSIFEDESNNKEQIKKVAGWRKAWTNWGLSKNQIESKFKLACEDDEAADKITSSGTQVSSSSSSSITFGSSGSYLHSYSHR
uniref:Uncharacterized protein n=1 Tax=Kalanchoe fedtschenkoi TaxID=63787 RepID=A0A7N0U490_KALFE